MSHHTVVRYILKKVTKVPIQREHFLYPPPPHLRYKGTNSARAPFAPPPLPEVQRYQFSASTFCTSSSLWGTKVPIQREHLLHLISPLPQFSASTFCNSPPPPLEVQRYQFSASTFCTSSPLPSGLQTEQFSFFSSMEGVTEWVNY